MHDVGIGVLDQAVDERDTHRAGTDDEIVGLELTLPGARRLDANAKTRGGHDG